MTKFSTRVAVGLGTGAVALASLTLTAPTAQAESGITWWEDGNSRFEMMVSNTTPAVDDVITISNNFQRKWSDEYIYSVKYLVPSCLEFVPGSARWSTSPVAKVDDNSGDDPAFVKANAPSITSWKVTGLGAGFGAKVRVGMDFTVTKACATGEPQGMTMHYGGSLGDGTYKDKGPTITVAKSTNPGGGNGGDGDGNGGGVIPGLPGGEGSASGGSLGGLFGGLLG